MAGGTPAPFCGNGVLDTGEACDLSVPPVMTFFKPPPCAPGSVCVACECKKPDVPVCGDGIVNDGDLCEPTANVATWKCPPPETGATIAEYYDCTSACVCIPKQKSAVCHDGKFAFQPDPALPNYEQCDSDGTVADGTFATPAEEQASSDARCATGETCLFNCSCWKPSQYIPETPPETLTEETGVKTCALKISGASTEAAKNVLNEINERVHKILGTESIDLFGEVGYSVAAVSITFPDTAAAKNMALASGTQVIVADDAQLGPWALIQTGGTPPYDYRTAYFKPVIAAVKSPMVVFPVGLEAAGKAKAQSLGLKEVVFPDLSSSAGLSGVTLTDVVGVLGSEKFDAMVGEIGGVAHQGDRELWRGCDTARRRSAFTVGLGLMDGCRRI